MCHLDAMSKKTVMKQNEFRRHVLRLWALAEGVVVVTRRDKEFLQGFQTLLGTLWGRTFDIDPLLGRATQQPDSTTPASGATPVETKDPTPTPSPVAADTTLPVDPPAAEPIVPGTVPPQGSDVDETDVFKKLKNKGNPVSLTRQAVLRILTEAGKPLSVPEILQLLASHGKTLKKDAVEDVLQGHPGLKPTSLPGRPERLYQVNPGYVETNETQPQEELKLGMYGIVHYDRRSPCSMTLRHVDVQRDTLPGILKLAMHGYTEPRALMTIAQEVSKLNVTRLGGVSVPRVAAALDQALQNKLRLHPDFGLQAEERDGVVWIGNVHNPTKKGSP